MNLVFFKLGHSKTKCWKIVGRGTRLRPARENASHLEHGDRHIHPPVLTGDILDELDAAVDSRDSPLISMGPVTLFGDAKVSKLLAALKRVRGTVEAS